MTQRQATAADLASVLKACAEGDIVSFLGPTLDVNQLPVRTPTDPRVRIQSAGATLTGWPNQPTSNLTLSGFNAKGGINRPAVALWAPKGGYLAIENGTITGPGGLAAGNEGSSGEGLVMMGCVQARKLKFKGLYSGVSVQGGIGHVVEGCEFDDLWFDAIDLACTEFGYPVATAGFAARVSRCKMTDFRGGPAHLDCIQLIKGALTLPTIIEDVVYVRGAGQAAQGIFTDSAPGPVIARRNAFLGGAWEGISIYGAKAGTIIEDNFLQGWNVVATAAGEICTPSINSAVGYGRNTILPNTKGGDRSALDAWLASRASGQPPVPQSPPAPVPAPPPIPPVPPAPDLGPALVAMTKERDALASKIARFKAARAALDAATSDLIA